MKISILTLFPDMFTGFTSTSIIKNAIEKGSVEFEIVDYRKYTKEKHGHVDDYPYGGGSGLVLMCQPILDALHDIKTDTSLVILLTPQGTTFNQAKAMELTGYDHLIFLCGHYEGFDERIRYYVDMQISIGDFVLTGGELASMVISDAVVRLLDGVITEQSHMDDSFSDGLLEYPHYTRPQEYEGYSVPGVLVSGHHENIRKFRMKESLRRTWKYRPDLLEKKELNKEQEKMLQEIIDEENVK